MVSIVVSLAVALVSLGPVDEAIERAQTQAASGDVAAAIETIRQAREHQEDPDLLYVEAQLHRIDGDCVAAVPLYEAFLASGPPEEDRAAAEATLEQCRDQVGEPAAPPDTQPETTAPSDPPPPVVTPPDPQPQPDPRPAPAEQGSDQVGLALWIAGGVLVAGGATTYGASWGLKARATRGDPTLDDYLGRERRASTLSGVGIAVLSVGAAVLVGATIRHFVRRR